MDTRGYLLARERRVFLDVLFFIINLNDTCFFFKMDIMYVIFIIVRIEDCVCKLINSDL